MTGPGPGIGGTPPAGTTQTEALRWAQIAALLAAGFALPFVEALIRNAEEGGPVTLERWDALLKLNAKPYSEL